MVAGRGRLTRMRAYVGALRRTGMVPRPGPPRLSVIVPVYNVEEYLAECLESILGQTYRDFEVVIVDDGSTDRSSEIAGAYARRHANLSVVRTENRGLGAARNRGVLESRGELLAFVDSDDKIPDYAYALMVDTLDRSGSDFVVGSARRFEADRAFQPLWLRRLHARRRLGIVADDFPEILGDVFAWNKIFRRYFWDRQQLSFAEGVRYEDQVMLTRAYLTAGGFDVVRRPVYDWRLRHDESSITQRRHEIADLRDRVLTKRWSLETARALGSGDVVDIFLMRVLAGDMPQYLRQIPGCSDEYWELLRDGVREIWGSSHSLSESILVVQFRLLGWLVEHDRRTEAETVLAFVADHQGALPVEFEDGAGIAHLPYWDAPESGIPRELYRLREQDLRWDATLTDVRIDGTDLVVEGMALVRGPFAVTTAPEAEVVLVATGGQRVGPAELTTPDRAPTGAPPGPNAVAFAGRFDLTRLDDAAPPGPPQNPGMWLLRVGWSVPGLRRDGPPTGFAQGLPGRSATRQLAGRTIDVTVDERVGLRVETRCPRHLAPSQ